MITDDDIADLRKEYLAIDPTNHKAMIAWLSKYPELAIWEYALVMGKPAETVIQLRSKYRLCRVVIVEHDTGMLVSRRPSIRHQPIVAPRDWDDQWLLDQYNNGVSVNQLSEATGWSRVTITNHLKRLGAVIRDHRLKCDEHWLRHHYDELGETIGQMAEQLGMSPYAVTTHMLRYGIQLRDKFDGTVVGKKIMQIIRGQSASKASQPASK